MMNFLTQITFLQAPLLAALLVLPLLWYLLRITPPAPKRIFFPATRFLMGLIPDEHTPSKTPWWILLLRLFMAALIITALARPVLNKAEGLTGNDPVRLVIDNSWPSAQTWDLQMEKAEETIALAGREKREIYILTTAAVIGEKNPLQAGPLSEGDATSILRGLSPMPWPADYAAMSKLIDAGEKKSIHSLWLSHGLAEGDIINTVKLLQQKGGLEFFSPPPEKLPLLLRPAKQRPATNDKQSQPGIFIDIDAPETLPENFTASVQAQGQNNDILDIQTVIMNTSKLPQTISFNIMETLHNDLSQFRISQRKGAGAIYLLDDQSKKRDIGIAGAAETSDSAPLIEDSYYIKRALEPYANVTLGNITDLIAAGKTMITLTDVAAMPAETLNTLEKWVKDGGLLLRFSGPNMAESQADHFLLPVNLRSGGRSLSGAMTWEKPQTISPFAETSPFFGLEIPQDLTIKQQILADPAQDLTGKVWAQLADGTPLITAAPLEKGLIVLIHTSAGPNWSDLALTGLYVNMLRRISALAGSNFSTATAVNNSTLEPLLIMDGNGVLGQPSASTLPIPAKDAEKMVPDSQHPPGLYGHGSMQYALNMGTALPPLNAVPQMPMGVEQKIYGTQYELDLMPHLLSAAMILFLLDWLIMILLTSAWIQKFSLRALRTASLLIIFTVISQTAYADPQTDLEYGSGLYLAYMRSGDTSLDSITQQGLENLVDVLKQRTSVEPDGVVGIDPENDTLAFFPLIYWAISENQKSISDEALKRIQFYLDHGGTIIFDTRDQNRSTTGLVSTPSSQALRAITSSLNIPPLTPIGEKHVLGQTFYLLRNFPGRFDHGVVWIEQESANGRDGVSSVIIGSNDWAGAWASYTQRYDESRFNPLAGPPQSELAMRFGVNLMMYALTGNYKADQVHVPHILERLGQ